MEPTNAELYERDFFEWTRVTAAALRHGQLASISAEAAAEEIEDMGKRDYREIRSRTAVLIAHMLKWQFQPDKRTRSWLVTIALQRQDIALVFEQSPSLRRKLLDDFDSVYNQAVSLALVESGLPEGGLPRISPWTFEQVIDPAFQVSE